MPRTVSGTETRNGDLSITKLEREILDSKKF